MKDKILIKKMKEKKMGFGEDSEPILLVFEDSIVLGVFDGVGGSGGTTCKSNFSKEGEDKTKAYIGSRIIRDAIEIAIRQDPSIILNEDFVGKLTEIINKRYAKEKEAFPQQSKGILRSSLIKEYPTTLSLLIITKTNNQYIINSYWAGDSRNYLWTEKGLYQISIDDLKGNLDPLQNLYEDAQMTNCIQAESPFTIRNKRITVPLTEKFIVMSATDGCFGYYQSPMDFYKALLSSLQSADDSKGWRNKLTDLFESVTADDFSFSVAAIGFKSFKLLKNEIKEKTNSLIEYFRLRSELDEKIHQRLKIDSEIKEMNDKLFCKIHTLWPEYKISYMKYMQDYEER